MPFTIIHFHILTLIKSYIFLNFSWICLRLFNFNSSCCGHWSSPETANQLNPRRRTPLWKVTVTEKKLTSFYARQIVITFFKTAGNFCLCSNRKSHIISFSLILKYLFTYDEISKLMWTLGQCFQNFLCSRTLLASKNNHGSLHLCSRKYRKLGL